MRQTDRQTETHRDTQTDRQTDNYVLDKHASLVYLFTAAFPGLSVGVINEKCC